MRKALVLVSLFLLVISCALAISVDDFLPPVQGGSTELSETASVTSSADDEVVSLDLQDGFNYASKLIWEEQQGDGFKAVVFPSGTGYIAGATSSYSVYENINATLIAKRAAYMTAYYLAKGYLAQGLNGYFTRKKKALESSIVSLDDTEKNIGGFYEFQFEKVEQVVEAMLRGYVTYEVKDIAGEKSGKVYVSIVISPKTLAAVNQVSDGVISSADLATSLQFILNDIEAGIVPPIGGKVIYVPEAGTTAVVAFGSAIARHSSNEVLANEYKKAAIETARMRATQTLVDILKGDINIWKSGFEERTLRAEFENMDEVITKADELRNSRSDSVAETMSSEFLNLFSRDKNYESVSSGIVPAGTMIRIAMEESIEKNGYGWVFAIAVYYPELELPMQQIIAAMEGKPVVTEQPIKETTTGEKKESGTSENPQGPTGPVSSDDKY
ncbi:MAG TPA: hypothetical protein PK411_14250 [Mesotoga infera]|uniref:Uncharacterized protein n=1 Tax=Mesotoga infera TaxID=1236046 RepID=A0A7Z7LE91_9BACT|nr:hypothetical protein [Mesotoga infera]SSC12409.1 conserved exported protein of unknown function [Mesotoga infera]HPD39504.1 hypothetical protein [Mesotoga infera]HRV03128.1 hypothetical protein [Mesotoga sp.]